MGSHVFDIERSQQARDLDSSGAASEYLIRTNPDETMTHDPCDMKITFQGADPNADTGGNYRLIPYRLGMLTPDWELAEV